MKITDFNQEISTLEKSKRKAILALIDLKTDVEMERVLSEMKSIKESMNSEMKSFKESMNSNMNTLMICTFIFAAIYLLLYGVCLYALFEILNNSELAGS